MVDRCKIKKQGCVIVDLDGTFIKGNSLKLFTSFLLKKLLKDYKIKEILSLSYFIILRKFKLIPHKKMKYEIISSGLENLEKKDIENFANILKENTNSHVIDLLNLNYISGYKILLATAAPELYLQPFIKLFNFDIDLIGTRLSDSYENFIDNKGEEKLKSVENYLMINTMECQTVLTDHEDDLPLLLRYPTNNYLVSPSKKTLNNINKFPQIIYKIIK